MKLLADGTEKETRTVTPDAAGKWSYAFEDLPKYESGREIKYTVEETAVAEYTAAYDGWNIENSYEPEEVSVRVSKKWTDAEDQDGKRPEYIEVRLLADGEALETAVLTAGNGWSKTWEGLARNRLEGNEAKAIAYTVD